MKVTLTACNEQEYEEEYKRAHQKASSGLPPLSNVTPIQWQSVYVALDRALSTIGERNDFTEGDYGMSMEPPGFRQQAIGINSLRMFSKDFLHVVQRFLRSLPDYWMVHVACELYSDDYNLPWGELFITRDSVVVHSADGRLAKEFDYGIHDREKDIR